MNDDSLRLGRRSTRLTISIHIFVSGIDADGNSFSESVQTQIVNEHGGLTATTHHLVTGAEVLVENRTMGVAAKARVVWWGGRTPKTYILRGLSCSNLGMFGG